MQALCPNCSTNPVEVPRWEFSDTTVTVPFCGECRTKTFVVGATVKVSAVGQFAIPQTVTRHRDGLVTFV